MNWEYFIVVISLYIAKLYAFKSNHSLHTIWNSMDWGPVPDDPSSISSILFYKYADKSAGISVAALKNFVNCIADTSKCSFTNENLSERFLLLSDCEINTALSPDKCDMLHKCIKEEDIFKFLPNINDSDSILTENEFKSLLPLILYQLPSKFCEEIELELESSSKKPSYAEVWGYGLLFVTLISGCSLAGVSVLPLMAADFYQKLLTVLIGLAVGSLAASAVFHLIPQAYGLLQVKDHEDYLFLSLCILIGVWTFFMIERILKVIFIFQKVKEDSIPSSVSSQTIVSKSNKFCHAEGSCRSDSNFDYGSPCGGSVNCNETKSLSHNDAHGECVNIITNGNVSDMCSSSANKVQLIYASQEQAIKASFGHEHKPEKSHEIYDFHFHQGRDSVIATVAWMIIFGDGFHNFIDGVSIGAAFQESILTGISISLAVMCEELPHELGDFAVLLNSGMTMKQALFYNFLSATTCYIGMAVGILIGEFTQNSTYVFALAAGMFLYISLVDMLPEMNETAAKAAEKSFWDVMHVLFLQNLGLFLGVFSLFLMAFYQNRITLG